MSIVETKEELEILKGIEGGHWESLGKKEFEQMKKESENIAENTIRFKTRKRPLNIRLFEEDLLKIKSRALREGIPYQTYLSSIIHKFVNNETLK